MDEELRHERDGPVGRIVLDGPGAMNTITPGVLDGIHESIAEFEGGQVRCVVIEGAGDRAFSAGANLEILREIETAEEARSFARHGQRTCSRLERSSLPIIARIDGFCLGGGMELATGCDVRVASNQARFGLPESRLGLMPGWGATQRLSRLVGEASAREIMLSGEHYDADHMERIGFLTAVADADALDEGVREWTDRFANGPPGAYTAIKRAIRAGRDDFRAGVEAEARLFGRLRSRPNADEGLAAFLDDREPAFENDPL